MNFWKNLSTRRKEVFFFLSMVLFGVLKEFLVYNLPIMAVPKGIHDDWIMVHMADALRGGRWLGEYNDLTLTKGMFFPFYLAVLNFLHLSYLSVSAFLYTVSCMIFVYALRPLLKKYRACLTLYLVLLWNPVSYSVQAFQRVYRNSISYIQVLLIFGGLLALWLRRKEPVKKQLLWLLTAAIGMVTFFYTREDAIWVEPFLIVFVLVYLGNLFVLWRKEHAKVYVAKAVLILLPFLSVWGAGQLIAQENYTHYNISLTNELQKGGFAEMYKSMMAVKPEEDIPGVTMTREKVARMCDECPTLKKLEPYIQSSRIYWAGSEENEKDWEVRDGWVFWIFRTALEQAGYYTDGGTVNQVCLQIRDELETAMDEGRLERQATMPSTYMSPWRKGYLGDLFGALGKAIAYTTTYDEMETLVYLYSEPDDNGGIPLFERMTGDKAVWYESNLVEMAGWYASYEGMDGVTLQAELADGTVLGAAGFTESDDIASYLAGQGIAAPGSEKCRFSLKLSVEDKPQTIYLKSYRNGALLDSYELSDDVTRIESDTSCLNLDWYWDVPERHGFLAKINYKGIILNGVCQAYHYTGAIAGAAGAMAYLVLCVRMLKRRLKKVKDADGRDLSVWLTLSALLASYFVLLGGISYSEISGWNAILYWYLSGAYPIMIAFEGLAVLFLVQEFRGKAKQ